MSIAATTRDDDGVGFLQNHHDGFGVATVADEGFHGTEGVTAHDACETWWFDVQVPEENLVAIFYVSLRPNLGVCSAGTWMWRGHHGAQATAEHLNYQIYVPMPQIGDSMDIPQVGLRLDFDEPLERTRITYAAPDGSAEASIVVDAALPVVMRANGKHFEGATRTTGTLRIGETTYAVDSHGFRDRSWGEPRSELAIAHPPIGWLCGTLDDGRGAFNLSGLDDPSTGGWADLYPQAASHTFYDGWIQLDGELRKVVRMTKRTTRDPHDLMRPHGIEVDFVDDRGDEHRLSGELRSSIRMNVWPNVSALFGLTRWALDDRPAWGEIQDYIWPHYLRNASRGNTP